ncbi:MAG: DUF1295 domain-containing protein [Bacteroidales bacterium]|nr:DUF1295 domain-containing protein [Bacteroidales bacterium]
MVGIAVLIFFALYRVKAGYGILIDKKWGVTLPNRWAWMIMEAPVVIAMFWFWAGSPRQWDLVPFIFFVLFQTHYLQRSFIFPWCIRGKSRMPISIVLMGIVFNLANAFIQGQWIFYLAPEHMYNELWLTNPRFLIGTLLFITGMVINIHSDGVIRKLREDGNTKHYLPEKGLFKYVTSANYFGEIIEWLGFAVLTWSLSGFVFFIWTFANLVPRAHAIYDKYREDFSEEMARSTKKRVFPFIY